MVSMCLLFRCLHEYPDSKCRETCKFAVSYKTISTVKNPTRINGYHIEFCETNKSVTIRFCRRIGDTL